jgi:hypothetical protein
MSKIPSPRLASVLGQMPATAPCARTLVFVRGHVRGMHQAPALVHRRVVQQPLHRALAAPGHAVIHLLRLLGDVDVDGRLRIRAP